MADDLFRPEAIKAQSGDRWGRPVGLLPVAWSRITLLLTLFVAAFIIFLMTAGFSRKETVRGFLKPVAAEARVYVPDVGAVTRLHVQLGDTVEKDQLLAEVMTARQVTADIDLAKQSLESLDRERASILERREAVSRAAALEQRRVQQATAGAREERTSLEKSIALTRSRLVIAEERVASYARLEEEGAASREEGRAREEGLIVQRQQMIDLEAKRDETVRREHALTLEGQRSTETLTQQISDIDQRLAQIDSQLAHAQSEAGYVVKAPVAGRIAAIQIAEGQRVDPSRPVMTILPGDGVLEASLYLPSRAIAFVEHGQSVSLRYDALPYQKFGSASGQIRSVSTTTFAPSELNAPIELKEPVYRVTVALDRQTMSAFGRDVPLQSGMELSADILLEKRKLVEWLLEPLYAATLRWRDPQ